MKVNNQLQKQTSNFEKSLGKCLSRNQSFLKESKTVVTKTNGCHFGLWLFWSSWEKKGIKKFPSPVFSLL